MTQQDFFKRYTHNLQKDKLGGGAFGTVYKAYDNVLDKYVAIKIAEVKTFGNKSFSLLDEFGAISDLPEHPNIANYEKVFTFEQPTGKFDFAIIQYYPHGNLSSLIKNEKLTQQQKEDIALQILEGLAFLHTHKVVHRDMKPSNILIHKRKGVKIIPKIADFGLSKKASADLQSRFTNSFGGGTLEYSSPEQLKGQALRFNTDLWAWALIVYELFTGKTLFAPQGKQSTGSAEREKEIFEQILNKDISIALSALPQNWQQALAQCLQRNPDKRIKSTTQIKNILKGVKSEDRANEEQSIYSVDEKTIIQQKSNIVENETKTINETKPIATINAKKKNNGVGWKNILFYLSLGLLFTTLFLDIVDVIEYHENLGKITLTGMGMINQEGNMLPIIGVLISLWGVILYFIYRKQKNIKKWNILIISISIFVWFLAILICIFVYYGFPVSGEGNIRMHIYLGFYTLMLSLFMTTIVFVAKLMKKWWIIVTIMIFLTAALLTQFPSDEYFMYAKAMETEKNEHCQEYLNHFPNGMYVKEIQLIQKKNKSIYDHKEWNETNKHPSISTYENYIKKFPDGEYVNQARDSIDSIKRSNNPDLVAYDKAKKGNVVESYLKYLSDFPTGEFRKEAKKSIESIESRYKFKYGVYVDSRDNKSYKTIKIGTQTWLAENFAFKTSEGCYYYNDEKKNIDIYGYLYNQETAKRVAPNGWHLPSMKEYQVMLKNICGTCNFDLIEGNNEEAYFNIIVGGHAGFGAILSGGRNSYGEYGDLYDGVEFWTSDNGVLLGVYNNSFWGKNVGFYDKANTHRAHPVRYIKDY